MQKFYYFLLLSIFTTAGLAAEPVPTQDELPAYSRTYSPERDAFKDGLEALALARDTDRLVLIELGGEWCGWCKVMDKFLQENPPVRDEFHAHFVLLKVNVSDENKNEDFRAGLPATDGYPHFFVSDQKGRIVHSQDNTELLSDGRYDIEKFRGFIQLWGNVTGGNQQP
jgi:thioredoxin-related protein